MEHTPEPWSLLSQRQDMIKGKDGSHILECIGHETHPRTQANAARIVQCVNDCEGIEHPKIYMSQLAYERDRARQERNDAEARAIKLKAERNELLEKLQGLKTTYPTDPLPFNEWAQNIRQETDKEYNILADKLSNKKK
jgi:hypothetical protein